MAAAVESSPVLTDPPGQRVLSVRHYEAMPPANIAKGLIDGDVIATTKEEEWVTKKKVELTTTRQIETRVKRQLVLEDGKVVEDSGPIVSTNTTEDTEKQENTQTEHRTTGDDPPGEGWLAIPMEGEGLIKEVRERTVHSKEEKQELLETEDVKHLGDLSDEAYLSSVRSNQDVRLAVKSGGQNSTSLQVSEGPRIVHQSSRSRRVVDTDDAQELSRVQNGHVVTETRHTTEHEEDRGEHVPEDDGEASEEERETNHKEGTQRYAHTKEQDLVEFLGAGGKKIGEHMRYQAENVEGATEGDPDPEWESLSTRMQKMRRHQPGPAAVGSPIVNQTAQEAATAAARKDALTKRPLDFDQEEETRKVETSKWLEHHFGSDSRSSKSSIDDEQPAVPSGAHFINVTMKSRPINGTGTKITRATPSPRPTSPPVAKPIPAVFSPARVFLSSPEPNSEPTSLQSPPPPPPPVMPTSTNHPLNGRQNSSSSGGSAGAGFFQGVSEWSERRNSNGIATNVNGRQDRVQVLPTGPAHTFNPTPVQNNNNNFNNNINNNSFVSTRVNGFTNQSSFTHSHVNGTSSPPSVLNRVNNSTFHTPVQNRLNGTSSPISSVNTTRINGTTSPQPLTTQHRLNGSVSPTGYPPAQRPISPPQGYRSYEEEEENATKWRGRAVSPPRQQTSRGVRDRRGSADLLEPRDFVEVPRTERRGSADLLRNRRGSSELRTERRGSSELLKVERRYSSPPPKEMEPPPDYSPGRRRRSRVTSSPSPSPPPQENSRKLNQKTRFADPPQQKTKSSFGDSLRRFVGKFRSGDDKNKKRKSSRTTSPSRSYRQGSENNNIPSSANRRLRVGRGESPPNEAVRRGYTAEDAEEEVYSDEEEGGMTSPVPPPRVRQRQPSPSHHHQLDSRLRRDQMMEPRKFYLGEDPFGGSIYGREKEYDGVTPPARSGRSSRHHNHRSRRGSNQDEEVTTPHTRNVVWHEEVRGGNSRASPPRAAPVSSSTLGRYSRSAGRLHSQFDEGGAPRSTQTLPRKLHRDEPSTRVVTTTSRSPNHVTRTVSSTSQWESGGRLSRTQPHSGSLINVSFINNVTPSTATPTTGPAKPARTYRSSLARSQSFNVTANEAPPPRRLFQQQPKMTSYYRSNPHIHRLEEASSPLKSPGIISSISRSQRDLNEAIKNETIEEEENKFSPRLGSKSPSGILNGSNYTSGNLHENKKKLFMKGLLDRAPELYRTLHGDEAGPVSPSAPHATSTPHRVEYSSSFRSSDSSMLTPGVRPARTRRSTTSPPNSLLSPPQMLNGDTKTLLSPSQSFRSHTSGTGSNKDYSETVRFTSTSDDPVRPSVTNTVKNFSKKTVASPRASGGVATETIESTETTTVTKSRVRDPQSAFISSYSTNSLGKNKYLMDQNTASPTRNGGVVIEVRNNNR